MRTALGGIVGIAVVGAIVYFGFIHSTYDMKVDDSYAWTENCVNHSEPLSIDKSATEQLSQAITDGRVIVIKDHGHSAAILLSSSQAQARQTETFLRNTIVEGAKQNGLSLSDAEASRRIFRRGYEVFAYSGPQRIPPQQVIEEIGRCTYQIRKNRWSSQIGIDLQEIGRPFFSKST